MQDNTKNPQEQNPTTAIATQEQAKLNHSERFTNRILQEFGGNVSGALQITDYQRQLIQGYFICIDRALKLAEDNRITKNRNNKDPKWNNELPSVWDNVNLAELALDVVHYARMGLDMMQDNHLFPIPFKNNKLNKYDVTLMIGYNGIQYVAEKYAVDPPIAVTVELVHKTDTFKPIKKNQTNQIESYEFEIIKPFDRGDVVGGFGYIEYKDPAKNKLIIMTLASILKRKPSYAAAEFWGGKSKKWENGKQVEVELEGWQEEMYLKTVRREVFSSKHIPRDPKKIDDNYQHMKVRETRMAEMATQDEIYEHANRVIIDADVSFAPDNQGEIAEPAQIPLQGEPNNAPPAGSPDF